MLNDEYFATLKDLAVLLASQLLQPEDFDELSVNACFMTYCSVAKVLVCKRCCGTGRKMNRTCTACKGKCHTGLNLPSVESVEALMAAKHKVFEKRLMTVVARYAEQLRKKAEALVLLEKGREEKRIESIAFLSDSDREDFIDALNEGTGSFITSIKSQWKVFGKLSENQVNAVLRSYKQQCLQDVEKSLYKEYRVGETASVKGKIVSIRQEVVDNKFGAGEITKISIKTHSRQEFHFSTGSEKLISRMDKLCEDGTWFTLSAAIKWISENNKHISVSSKGLKIEE
jgi:hypothetical protein